MLFVLARPVATAHQLWVVAVLHRGVKQEVVLALHLYGASADTQDVASAVPRVLNVHGWILRGIGTLVILDTLAPDTRENACEEKKTVQSDFHD